MGQGLGIIEDHLEHRREGYGYQVKEGHIDAVVERLHRSRGELTHSNASAFHPFVEALAAGLFSNAIAVKGQIEGPITLSSYLFHKGQPFIWDPALFAAVAFHVSQMLCWQIAQLRSASDLPVLLFIDEPALCLEAPDYSVPEEQRLSALSSALNDVRSRGALAGLHCCASHPFQRMCLVQPDVISFDAHVGLESFFADPAVRTFLMRGGMVAYGLVPTSAQLDPLDAPGLFTRWLKAAASAGDAQDLARRAMVTATCGLGMLDSTSVAESFQLLQEMSALMRTFAGSQ